MLQVIFVLVVLIATFYLNKEEFKENRKGKNIYFLLSGGAIFVSMYFIFEPIEIGYGTFMGNIFGDFTNWVIGR